MAHKFTNFYLQELINIYQRQDKPQAEQRAN